MSAHLPPPPCPSFCSNVLTGSYNNNFYIYDRNGKNDVTLQADKSAFKAKRVGSARNKMAPRVNNKNGKNDINVESIDFTKKILHASWHPRENSIAVAATNNLFIFTYVSKWCFLLFLDPLVASSFFTKY